MNYMLNPMESSLQDRMRLWCRAAPGEEVYSFRQMTQYAAFTPDTLSSIASALKAFGIWQVADFVLLYNVLLYNVTCQWLINYCPGISYDVLLNILTMQMGFVSQSCYNVSSTLV